MMHGNTNIKKMHP